jgi:hypothetical protein
MRDASAKQRLLKFHAALTVVCLPRQSFGAAYWIDGRGMQAFANRKSTVDQKQGFGNLPDWRPRRLLTSNGSALERRCALLLHINIA